MSTDTSETRIEWRVESETTEDEFGTNEERAREWFALCQANPHWEPSTLMRQTVTITRTAWEPVETSGGDA